MHGLILAIRKSDPRWRPEPCLIDVYTLDSMYTLTLHISSTKQILTELSNWAFYYWASLKSNIKLYINKSQLSPQRSAVFSITLSVYRNLHTISLNHESWARPAVFWLLLKLPFPFDNLDLHFLFLFSYFSSSHSPRFSTIMLTKSELHIPPQLFLCSVTSILPYFNVSEERSIREEWDIRVKVFLKLQD